MNISLPYSERLSTCLVSLAKAPLMAASSGQLRYVARQTLPHEGNVANQVDRRMAGAFRDATVQSLWVPTKLEFCPVAPILTEPIINSHKHTRREALECAPELRRRWLRFTGKYTSETCYLTKDANELDTKVETWHSEVLTSWDTVTSLYLTLNARNIKAGRPKYRNWTLLNSPPADPHVQYDEVLADDSRTTVHAFVPFDRDWSTGEFRPEIIGARFDEFCRPGQRLEFWLPSH